MDDCVSPPRPSTFNREPPSLPTPQEERQHAVPAAPAQESTADRRLFPSNSKRARHADLDVHRKIANSASRPCCRTSRRPGARRYGTCRMPGRAPSIPTPSRHRRTSSINASLANPDRPPPAAHDAGQARACGHRVRGAIALTLAKHPHPVPPWPRRDAAAPRLPVAPGKSRRARLLAMTRRGIGFPILVRHPFLRTWCRHRGRWDKSDCR